MIQKTRNTAAVATLLLLLIAVLVGEPATAGSGPHVVYLPLVENDTCVGCGPKPTPTPRGSYGYRSPGPGLAVYR